MAGEVASVIGLIKDAYTIGLKVVKTLKTVSDNFEAERNGLEKMVQDLSKRFVFLEMKVKKSPNADWIELKGVLDRIKDLFEEISVFCTKLAKLKSNQVSKIIGRLWKCREYTDRFDTFLLRLKELDDQLSKWVGDTALAVIFTIADMQRKEEKLRELEKDRNQLREEVKRQKVMNKIIAKRVVKFSVMEYMEKGTLRQVLFEETELNLEKKLCLADTAARSLYSIHSCLVHTALRTENFLVNKDYTAKLSSMGYAMTFSSCKRSTVSPNSLEGLYFYRAPERADGPIKSSKEADIYAFGIILWEIFTQTKPFSSVLGEDASEDAVQKFICKDKKEEFELKLDDRLNDDLSQLVRRCRSFDPKDRPKISEIESVLSEIRDEFQEREFETEPHS